jgi:hypothetical protein
LVLLHLSLILLMRTDRATHAVWFTNVVSASLFLPLLVFDAIHLPVFGHREGFSWAPFTLLGWVLLCLFWATVYWVIAYWVIAYWGIALLGHSLLGHCAVGIQAQGG